MTYGIEIDTSVNGRLATNSRLQLFPFGQQFNVNGGQSLPIC